MSDLVSVSAQVQTGDASTASLVSSGQSSSGSRATKVHTRHVMQLVEGDNMTSIGYVYYDEYNTTTNEYITIRRLVVHELVQAVMQYSSKQSVTDKVTNLNNEFTFQARVNSCCIPNAR
jgi:hypothetical protein